MLSKAMIVTILKKNILFVRFKKRNGKTRDLYCTLIPEKIVYIPSKYGIKRTFGSNVVPVWDIQKQAWRAFRISHVMQMKILK